MSQDIILDLIDNAIRDSTSADAMRWTPDADAAVSVPPRRPAPASAPLPRRRARPSGRRPGHPMVDPPRLGCQLVPFVGGPRACDLRAVRIPLSYTILAMPPMEVDVRAIEDPTFTLPDPIVYFLRWVTVHSASAPPRLDHIHISFRARISWEFSVAQVYSVDGATAQELNDALAVAFAAGWQP